MRWFRRQQAESILDEEIEAHIAERIDDLVERGIPAAKARQQALIEFGNVTRIKEDARGVWSAVWWEQTRQDLVHAFRSLMTQPGFSIVAILTLAISVGAGTAVFSEVNTVFFAKLPVAHPEELRSVWWTAPHYRFAGPIGALLERLNSDRSGKLGNYSYPVFLALREQVTQFSDAACDRGWSLDVDDTPSVDAQFVSGSYFATLGVHPFIGRLIAAEDDRPEASPVAVVSYSFWKRVLNGDPAALGRTLRINKLTAVNLIGVTPREFYGFDPQANWDIQLPFSLHHAIGAERLDTDPWATCQRMIARLHPEGSDESAQAEAESAFRHLILAANPGESVDAVHVSLIDASRGIDSVRKDASLSLPLLMAAMMLILLIACAGVGGLLLARGAARQREIATRLALGASRGRLIRQLLTENLMISVIAGGLGIALTFALTPSLPDLLAHISGVPRLSLQITPDLRVLGFAIALTLITGGVFGLAPAILTANVDLISAMKKRSSSSDSGSIVLKSSKAVVTLQVALSILLLVGLGLFVRTFFNLKAGFGYKADGLVFFKVAGTPGASNPAFTVETLRGLAQLPGATSVGASVWPLFAADEHREQSLKICIPDSSPKASEDRQGELPGYFPIPKRSDDIVGQELVSSGYFAAWGVPFVSGGDFEWQDPEGKDHVTIVNESFARRFFGNQPPVGQTIGFGACPGIPVTIVGVVADSTNAARLKPIPMLYRPFNVRVITAPTFAVRSTVDLKAFVPIVRQFLRRTSTTISGPDVRTGEEYRDGMIIQEGFIARLLVVFAATALFISCLGLYGLLAYSVNRRTPEIGIRMALGAQRADVVRMIVTESLLPVTVGIATGLSGALLLTRFVEKMLFGIRGNDPWSFAVAALLFLVTGAVAAWLPAARASYVDPMSALRCE